MSCYDGNNFVGQIMVEHVLSDGQSSSDSSFETVSSDCSQLSLSELSRIALVSSNLKRGHKRKAHEKPIETKRFKKVSESVRRVYKSTRMEVWRRHAVWEAAKSNPDHARLNLRRR
ncbi:uncharacterized protein LOC111519739 [Drosophila willistoni]|uniref:uncharacterized protein LOC111519739 n=1 Tax=Drosophila willistoni TaxID=7260 RepID=UPI001F07A20E|nr:uncharacterized protein LOC111519739 [Drosophila willistoni]